MARTIILALGALLLAAILAGLATALVSFKLPGVLVEVAKLTSACPDGTAPRAGVAQNLEDYSRRRYGGVRPTFACVSPDGGPERNPTVHPAAYLFCFLLLILGGPVVVVGRLFIRWRAGRRPTGPTAGGGPAPPPPI